MILALWHKEISEGLREINPSAPTSDRLLIGLNSDMYVDSRSPIVFVVFCISANRYGVMAIIVNDIALNGNPLIGSNPFLAHKRTIDIV